MSTFTKKNVLSRFRVLLSRFPAYLRIAILTGFTIMFITDFVDSRYPTVSTPGQTFFLSLISVLMIAWTIRGCKREGYFKLSLTNYQSKLVLIFFNWLSAILAVSFAVSLGWKGGGAIAGLVIICTMILIAAILITFIISRIAMDTDSKIKCDTQN